MSSIFNQLLNVKGTVVEDVRIVDSPLRPEPVLEVRVRPRAGALRCSRCGRRRRGYDQGGGVRRCFASMFVRQVRQCFSAVWADGFPRCRHRFPVM
ncbi:hypothetical protein [Bifidobacterium longum]|nr:hypothetical protein [Bifidobacterium longum]MBV3097782.1 hypothetical protein [Bifidobacterium longum]